MLILALSLSASVLNHLGIGLSVNSMYREDGHRQQEHECEDLSFHFKYDEKTSLYGVFDGHDGFHFARYALDMITAEVLLGQLKDEISDNDVRQILKYDSRLPRL